MHSFFVVSRFASVLLLAAPPDHAASFQSLGDLSGGSFSSTAFAVSGDGSIIVGSAGFDSFDEAFIWDETNGMRELDVLFETLGLDLLGLRLTEAVGVSADGLTIVGSGVPASGQREAWIAVIPEPGTALLLGLGMGNWHDPGDRRRKQPEAGSREARIPRS